MSKIKDPPTYYFEGQIGGSFNFNARLRCDRDSSLWVGKLSRSLVRDVPLEDGSVYHFTVDFRDLDARALLAYRLAPLVGIRTLPTEIIPVGRVVGLPALRFNPLSENVFLTKFGGMSLGEYLKTNSLSSIKDLDDIFPIFVFNMWVGNYDKKSGDYLVSPDCRLVSIDYQLSGPGFQNGSQYSLGAWGEAYEMEDCGDTGWSLDGDNGVLMTYTRSRRPQLDTFLPAIKKINAIPPQKIKEAMRGLKFYYQGTKKVLNDDYFNYLLRRRGQFETCIETWVNSGYTLTPRPKLNSII